MEDEKFKTINKMYRRPENCPAIVSLKVNSEIWNENLPASHRMTDQPQENSIVERLSCICSR